MKSLVESCVEGANTLDLCVEGDKLIEEGTSLIYNKSVKGVKVPKGPHPRRYFPFFFPPDFFLLSVHRPRVPNMYLSQQLRRSLFASRVRFLSFLFFFFLSRSV
jgi:hypothetical protein